MRINEKVEAELGRVKRELVELVEQNSFREELVGLADRLKEYG